MNVTILFTCIFTTVYVYYCRLLRPRVRGAPYIWPKPLLSPGKSTICLSLNMQQSCNRAATELQQSCNTRQAASLSMQQSYVVTILLHKGRRTYHIYYFIYYCQKVLDAAKKNVFPTVFTTLFTNLCTTARRPLTQPKKNGRRRRI